MSGWPTWLQVVITLYTLYAVIIVVRLYTDREVWPTLRQPSSHLVVWSLALGWLPFLGYLIGRRIYRRRRVLKAQREANARALRAFRDSFVEARRKMLNVDLPITGRHYDPVYRERIKLCFNPDCNCRGHERDPHYDPNVRNPEDYWR